MKGRAQHRVRCAIDQGVDRAARNPAGTHMHVVPARSIARLKNGDVGHGFEPLGVFSE